MSSEHIQLYLTAEHECSYLPGRMATNIVPDPNLAMDMNIYSQFLRLGYRRSGNHVYRPHCRGCNECMPCRIPAAHFSPRRTQQRCLKRNNDLSLHITEAAYTDEYFELYRDYLNARHGDGEMANPAPEDFKQFLYTNWSNTHFFEVRKQQRLLAVAVTDITPIGLSAVYTYFDPAEAKRSLGSFCIMQQIEQARRMQLPHLYMGYWIRNCQKMKYKADYQPMEIFDDEHWQAYQA